MSSTDRYNSYGTPFRNTDYGINSLYTNQVDMANLGIIWNSDVPSLQAENRRLQQQVSDLNTLVTNLQSGKW